MSEEFIREVDEDLRHQQLATFWKSYGKYIIATAVAIVLFVAGSQGYKKYTESKYLEVADQYTKALENIQSGNQQQALAALKALADQDVEGYKVLSAMQRAAIHLNNGEKTLAVGILENLSKSSGVSDFYKDLASLQAATILMDEATYEETTARLEPLLERGNEMRYLARELLAMSAIQNGDTEKAKVLLRELSEDLETPEQVKFRANQLLTVIE
ncbi:tetratricopeptide repeat protein [Emcibacter nanhaiensis]|uniref:Tetratricopeptide repeat protein n=1 Tax=Emcibacter nanhaiensis TaxID=1505037 RepID=A0A501PRR2_9PROT|nr:tetratricopeptide repeat protein [Emcibacter nanhaiensis]TPD62935.1 tetratricopeptide repeat protein [Emcibacter nanhaiensis]